MPRLDCPLLLTPVFKPKIWGRRDLAPLFPSPDKGRRKGAPSSPGSPARPPSEPIGEVWLTDDQARFASGPVAGLTLAEASEKFGPELYGKSWPGTRFPLLAKYIFTSDWLSVQVHPDDEYARLHEPASPGKCEMWYVIDVAPKGEILLGVKPGTTQQALRFALEKGDSPRLLRRFRPKAGEAIFVPPGTVHALGPGLVLFEAEQNSDITYRLDDFGRVGLDGKPRPLHLDKGMDVTQPDLPAHRNLPRLKLKQPYGWRRPLVACRHFAVEEIALRRTSRLEGRPERVEVFSVLEGQGRVENASGWIAYEKGQTWVIPPATGVFRLVPRSTTRLLKFYVPNIGADFRRPLARRKVKAKIINQIVFD